MSILTILILLLTVAVFGYLVATLLFPERF
ncbi:MAG: potassium-transporting ATPase subunit F [Acidobacteria bacterium]|nr:potassium-transporting ATPase subunit F [Acidobacteriota bacterium]